MKKIINSAIILLGIGFLFSCSKIGTKDDLIGTWKLTSSADALFEGDNVGSVMLKSARLYDIDESAELLTENLEFHENSVDLYEDGFNYNLVYSFEKEEIILSVFTRSIRWKVAKLSPSELVIDVGLEQFNEKDYYLFESGSLEIENVIKNNLSTSFKGKTIFAAVPLYGIRRMSDMENIRFYYLNSNGKRVPCSLVNCSIIDAFIIDDFENDEGVRLKDNLTFATSFQFRYQKQ